LAALQRQYRQDPSTVTAVNASLGMYELRLGVVDAPWGEDTHVTADDLAGEAATTSAVRPSITVTVSTALARCDCKAATTTCEHLEFARWLEAQRGLEGQRGGQVTQPAPLTLRVQPQAASGASTDTQQADLAAHVHELAQVRNLPHPSCNLKCAAIRGHWRAEIGWVAMLERVAHCCYAQEPAQLCLRTVCYVRFSAGWQHVVSCLGVGAGWSGHCGDREHGGRAAHSSSTAAWHAC
jgi:hypothetical protein